MKKLLLLACLCVNLNLSAQDTLRMNLIDCIKAAELKSPAILEGKQNLRSAYFENRLTLAGLRPQLNLRANLPGYTRTINQVIQPDGTFRFQTISQAFSNVGLTLDGQIAATGTGYSLISGLNNFQSFGSDGRQFWQSTPFALVISQPIFRFNNLLWEKKLAPIRYSIAQKRFFEQKIETDRNVTSLYFDLFQAQISLENARNNVKMNDTIYKISQGRFQVGTLSQDELLQAELALMRTVSERDRQNLDYRRAAGQLCIALGMPDRNIWAESLNEEQYSVPDTFLLISEAKRYRSDYENFDLQLMNARLNLKRTQMQYRPNATLNLEFGLNQTAPTWQEAYRSPLDRQTASVSLNIPIYSFGRSNADIGNAQADYQALKIRYENFLRQFGQDIWQAAEQLKLSQNQLKIALKADSVAQKRYELSANRYLIGKITIQNLQIAQDEKDRARREYIAALRESRMAYQNVCRLTLFDVKMGLPIPQAVEIEKSLE